VESYAASSSTQFELMADELMALEFGTRHEPTRQSHLLDLLKEAELNEMVLSLSDKKDQKNPDKDKDSAQMIYEFETMIAGATLVSGFTLQPGVTATELAALRSAFVHASEGVTEDGGIIVRFGGGSSKGAGRCAVYLHGLVAEGIEPTRYHATEALCPPRGEGEGYDPALTDYIAQLREGYAKGLDATKEML